MCFRVPEVPELRDVACIQPDLPPILTLSNAFSSLINSYGTIHSRAPVQIMATEEMPGALKIYWSEVNYN